MLYKVMKTLVGIVFKLIYRINIIGKENLPKEGPYIVCANHFHVYDPVLISIITPSQIFWMGKKEVFDKKFFGAFLRGLGSFPVNREEVELSTIRTSLKILKDNGILGIFPEGTRVKNFDIENAKGGVGLISIKSKSPILPIYIEGPYKPFRKVNVYIGEFIDLPSQYGPKATSEDFDYMGKQVLETIYSLPKEKEPLK